MQKGEVLYSSAAPSMLNKLETDLLFDEVQLFLHFLLSVLFGGGQFGLDVLSNLLDLGGSGRTHLG